MNIKDRVEKMSSDLGTLVNNSELQERLIEFNKTGVKLNNEYMIQSCLKFDTYKFSIDLIGSNDVTYGNFYTNPWCERFFVNSIGLRRSNEMKFRLLRDNTYHYHSDKLDPEMTIDDLEELIFELSIVWGNEHMDVISTQVIFMYLMHKNYLYFVPNNSWLCISVLDIGNKINYMEYLTKRYN